MVNILLTLRRNGKSFSGTPTGRNVPLHVRSSDTCRAGKRHKKRRGECSSQSSRRIENHSFRARQESNLHRSPAWKNLLRCRSGQHRVHRRSDGRSCRLRVCQCLLECRLHRRFRVGVPVLNCGPIAHQVRAEFCDRCLRAACGHSAPFPARGIELHSFTARTWLRRSHCQDCLECHSRIHLRAFAAWPTEQTSVPPQLFGCRIFATPATISPLA